MFPNLFLRSLQLVFFLLLPFGATMGGTPAAAPDQVRPLLIGAEIPEISVRSIDGEAVDLKAAVTRKPTVLIFYRGGW